MPPTPANRPVVSPVPYRRPLLLPGLFFLLGVALTGLWFHHQPPPPATLTLAAVSQNRLGALAAPVTLHFYSVLPANGDATLPAYAGRVALLLDAVQTASGGKVQVTRLETPADTSAATADGIQAFDLDQGAASFLGLTMLSGTNRETFARLDPDWEPALEFDLVRALVRVATPPPAPKPAPEIARPSPEIVASIHRLIPDVPGTSVATANQIFHAEFLKECGDAGTEMETAMNTAQQRVIQAQTAGAPAELAAAQKNLAQVQVAQAEKIRQIAANLQIRLAVFQNLKRGAVSPGN